MCQSYKTLILQQLQLLIKANNNPLQLRLVNIERGFLSEIAEFSKNDCS